MSISKQGQQQTQNQPAKRPITLQAADGGKFKVTDTIVKEMGTVIRSFLEEAYRGHEPDDAVAASITMPLVNVSSWCLDKIILYCQNHLSFKEARTPQEDIEAFDSGLVKDLSDNMIKELLLCANYLDMKDLLEMLEKPVANRIQNKSPEFVRKFFGIECDFSPEEEAKIRQDNSFAFEGIDKD